MEILDDNGIVQSQLVPLGLNLLLRSLVSENLPRRIAGRNGLQREDNDGNAQEDRNQKQKPLQDVS